MCLDLCSMNEELCECVSFTLASGRNYDYLCTCRRAARGSKTCYVRSWKTVGFLLVASVASLEWNVHTLEQSWVSPWVNCRTYLQLVYSKFLVTHFRHTGWSSTSDLIQIKCMMAFLLIRQNNVWSSSGTQQSVWMKWTCQNVLAEFELTVWVCITLVLCM